LMKPLMASILASVLCLAVPAASDPVPDAVVHRAWDLIEATAKTGQCPDVQTLVNFLGAYGLHLVDEEHVSMIRNNFGALAPVLVLSQAPPSMPRVSVQDLYRSLADAAQREDMLRALREWLTAEVNTLPQQGTMRIEMNPDREEAAIRAVRGMAAEMLADWDDKSAEPLMAVLEAESSFDGNALWHIRRARARLSDPCAFSFLRKTPESDLQCCATVSDLKRVTAGRTGWRYHQVEYELSPEEIGSLWAELSRSAPSEKRPRIISSYCIVFEFDNGVIADISPTGDGGLLYTDNTMIDEADQKIAIKNHDLHSLLWDLFESRMGVKNR
jgi:hypothetical protein